MARIVFGSYFVRYPQGGMMSHVLQYLVGLQRLGHEVYFVEKADPGTCFDPVANVMSDDCSRGIAAAALLLSRFGLGDRWCFVDVSGTYHGIDRVGIERIFSDADVFIDMGTHGAWLDESQSSGLRVLIDGEPGFNQIRMEAGELDPDGGYDAYVTNGRNVGTSSSPAPTAGREWLHSYHPVVIDMFEARPPTSDPMFTTVMNWASHGRIEYEGRMYYQKDVEFEKFLDLPRKVGRRMEVAVSGSDVPRDKLRGAGWSVRDGRRTTITFDSFVDYLRRSTGEFSVAKHVFVALQTGWFSDRSAAYLALGRPVVMQETGFSAHLPTGEGLFAVGSLDEAASAIDTICTRPRRHSEAARSIAVEYLDARKVLSSLLLELGVGSGPSG